MQLHDPRQLPTAFRESVKGGNSRLLPAKRSHDVANMPQNDVVFNGLANHLDLKRLRPRIKVGPCLADGLRNILSKHGRHIAEQSQSHEQFHRKPSDVISEEFKPQRSQSPQRKRPKGISFSSVSSVAQIFRAIDRALSHALKQATLGQSPCCG